MNEAPHRVINLELLRVWLGVNTRQGARDWAKRAGVKPLPNRGPRGERYYRVTEVLDAMNTPTSPT